jgi:hypothetical protein
MASRPQLERLNTVHDSTRYEVEFWSQCELWCLDTSFTNLVEAKARVSLNHESQIKSRIIVVSESRRILP